jgi:hypothetical protein
MRCAARARATSSAMGEEEGAAFSMGLSVCLSVYVGQSTLM